MPMSFDGQAANSSGWFIRPKGKILFTYDSERNCYVCPTGAVSKSRERIRDGCMLSYLAIVCEIRSKADSDYGGRRTLAW